MGRRARYSENPIKAMKVALEPETTETSKDVIPKILVDCFEALATSLTSAI